MTDEAEPGRTAGRARWNARRFWVVSAILFASALAIRLGYLHELRGTCFADERPLIEDTKYYDMRASEIAAGNLIGDAPGFLSPVYCHLLGMVYALPGGGFHAAKVLQAVLGALACVLLYWIGREIFSDGAGCLAGALLSVYGLHIYYTGILLPTITIGVLNLVFLWVLVSGTGRPSPLRFVVAGIFLGLATGAKANALLLLPLTALWIWFARRPVSPRQRLAWCAALAGGTLLALAPLTVRNYLTSDSFVLVTTSGGRNLMKGNGPDANGTHVFLPASDQGAHLGYYLDHSIDPKTAVQDNREMSARAWTYMRQHPVRTTCLFLRKLGLLLHDRELGTRDSFYFARTQSSILALPWLTFGLIAPFGLAGWILVGVRRGGAGGPALPLVGPLHVLAAVQVVSFVLIFVLARYRLVLVACLMLFASWLVGRLVDGVRSRDYRSLALAAALLAAAAAFVNLPDYGFAEDRGLAQQHLFLAESRYRQQEYGQAAASYQDALDSDWLWPQNPKPRRRALLGLGLAQMQTGRLAEAHATISSLVDDLIGEGRARDGPEMRQLQQLLQNLEQRLPGDRPPEGASTGPPSP
jgi:hypothetical protein